MRLRNRKAIELLVENAHVTDGEWIPDKAENAASESAAESEPAIDLQAVETASSEAE